MLVPEDGTTAQDEEHLFGSKVHMHPHPSRVGGQFVQRCSHPGVVRPPEDSMPSPVFFVISVPCVGEQVLTNHSVVPPGRSGGTHAASEAASKAASTRLLRGHERCSHGGQAARYH